MNISPAKAVAPKTTKMIRSNQDNAMLRLDSQRIPLPMPDRAESMAASVSNITAIDSADKLGLPSFTSHDQFVI